MTTWRSEQEPDLPKITATGWLRVILRGAVLIALILICLAALLMLRLVERPFFGQARPWSPFMTQIVCRGAFVILGIGFSSEGKPMRHPGGAVANHSSWLDIFALNARARTFFVSKSEVADWPGIGMLAKATGTVFIARRSQDAKAQKEVFETRLKAGHQLMFFPEGTSTDGLRVLPFKSTLFAAFFNQNLGADLWIQPVSLRYSAPRHLHQRFYGWWGDMDFAAHLLAVLAASPQGRVHVMYHPPLRVRDFTDRKALALACEEKVREGFECEA